MKRRLTIKNKILIILGFIFIFVFNFYFSFSGIGELECKHDLIVDIINFVAKCLEYIGLLIGIIFIIISKYKDEKYSTGIKSIIIIALIVPFVLSLFAHYIEKNDHMNDNCKLKESEWVTINQN